MNVRDSFRNKNDIVDILFINTTVSIMSVFMPCILYVTILKDYFYIWKQVLACMPMHAPLFMNVLSTVIFYKKFRLSKGSLFLKSVLIPVIALFVSWYICVFVWGIATFLFSYCLIYFRIWSWLYPTILVAFCSLLHSPTTATVIFVSPPHFHSVISFDAPFCALPFLAYF